MKLLKSVYHFFPVQLFLLHFRKSQVLLLFWFVLTATVNGNLLKIFGADALLLAPEYLNQVNMLSAFITGIALGVFVMSWNITTFILHSLRFKFLATTRKPFLKYCINNSLIPFFFIVFYFVRLIQFNQDVELMQPLGIVGLIGGIFTGFVLLCFISFAYFFGAELTEVYARRRGSWQGKPADTPKPLDTERVGAEANKVDAAAGSRAAVVRQPPARSEAVKAD